MSLARLCCLQVYMRSRVLLNGWMNGYDMRYDHFCGWTDDSSVCVFYFFLSDMLNKIHQRTYTHANI